MFQIGLAALRANGFRPDSRGASCYGVTNVRYNHQLPREKLRLLDQFRRHRAAGLYDGSFDPSEAEMQNLVAEVKELKSYFEDWLSKR